jgi:hypothetical protein
MGIRKILPAESSDVPPGIPDIFEAAATNNLESLEVALKYYDPNVQDALGMTALHAAATGLSQEAADRLLAAGTDPSIRDNFGRTAGWLAFEVWRAKGLPMADKLSILVAKKEFPTQELVNQPKQP